jgi:uncharacterized protein YggE
VFVRSLALLGVGTAVAALLASAPMGAAQTIPTPQPQPGSGISVVGQGIVLAQPNTAHITLGVEVFDQSLANGQSQAASRMDAVVSKLKASGVPDTDIHTVSFNITPQYDFQNQNQPVLRGYQIQNLVDVKTTNVNVLGAMIDDSIAAGATRVYGIRFEASNMEDLKNQARDQAMQNARAKAEQLARDAGVSLGRPTSINESDTGGVTPLRVQQAPQPAAAAAAPQTPIQPGELQVQTTVQVVWSIQ